MKEEEGYRSIDERSLDEPLPPYSTTWGNDVLDEKARSSMGPAAWSLTFDSIKQRVPLAVRSSTRSTSRFVQTKVWPVVKKFPFTKRQLFGLLLLVVCGILPFIILGKATQDGGYGAGGPLFYDVFSPKIIDCGDGFGQPQNSTISGIEALFVLDNTFGRFPFSQAKTIDVAWDILVGRGAQLFAWWVSYIVFSDALLRLIERHPATYETFMRIALEGPCLASAWILLKELFRKRSKRTWALFFYMLLSSLYVLAIPTFLSAMTGYDASTIAWVNPDNDDNIVPASYFSSEIVVFGTRNSTFETPTCAAGQQISNIGSYSNTREAYCDCQSPNGTVMPYWEWRDSYLHTSTYRRMNYTFDDCIFDYPGNTQTYEVTYPDRQTLNCNATLKVTIGNQSYDVADLNYTQGWCWEDQGYDYAGLMDSARCLPDTSHPTYQWGFSTMLSGVFIIINFIWCLTMYIVWQDAQLCGKLVKSGFRMTQLRAAFVLTEAAKQKTGFEERELITAEKTELEKELFGSKKFVAAEVDRYLFRDDRKGGWEEGDEGVRKRRTRSEEREV